MKGLLSKFFCLCVLVLLASCGSTSSVTSKGADAGIVQTYTGDFETIKVAALSGLRNSGVSISDTNDSERGYLITFSKSLSAFSWGEVGRVLVVKMADDKTKVSVVTEKRMAMELKSSSQADIASFVFNDITQALKNKSQSEE